MSGQKNKNPKGVGPQRGRERITSAKGTESESDWGNKGGSKSGGGKRSKIDKIQIRVENSLSNGFEDHQHGED